MKRWSYAVAVCSIAAITTTIAMCAFGETEKAASKPSIEMNNMAAATPIVTGNVVETMDSGGYTYICLEQNGKKTWFATSQMAVKKGQVMSFDLGMEMKNFTSKTLNRTFDSIYFVSGPITANPAGAGNAAPATYDTKKAPPSAATEKMHVKKATGKNAYTVAEVFEKKDSLNEKPAVIRGKVVKVSSGIMGKNWIHLQDGTGEAAKGTNDLVATSQDNPSVGDIVTIKGTVFKDKDFGAGYKYSVIMEQAKVQQ
ncbi:MAG TPA: DNA-binding protein [Nitrospirota bacterium]|nr:DNA-binding protein [Nitrospirota bacterium]